MVKIRRWIKSQRTKKMPYEPSMKLQLTLNSSLRRFRMIKKELTTLLDLNTTLSHENMLSPPPENYLYPSALEIAHYYRDWIIEVERERTITNAITSLKTTKSSTLPLNDPLYFAVTQINQVMDMINTFLNTISKSSETRKTVNSRSGLNNRNL
ncbi:MAG: hypothetical protein ACTSYA_04375 [Candidatus Kariarchaeaceae archaeon]